MSYLYVSEQGANIGITNNRFQVKYKDGLVRSIPIETLEVIEVFGNIQITTQCLTECLKRGTNILFYSTNGAYFGRLISTSHVNVQRQRKQAELGKNEEFKLIFSKRIITAKIRNQIVLLRRYARSRKVEIERAVIEMQNMYKKSERATSIEQVMGYEGTAAKIYFKVIGTLIEPEFSFKGRSKRPPLDPFNSMISLGYSIIMNELYGKIEGKGLNPYFGIMHKDREKHPTLASDLMEEWRAVLIDSTVLKVIQVATPEKRINEHYHKDYDVEVLWELNEDNEEGCENRCKEIQCPTLSKIKKEEIIKKHILAYDYKAGLDVVETLKKEETESYRDLIYLASRRIMLDFNGVDEMIRKTGVQCIPVCTSSERKYFEYALNLKIRLKKGEYVDFIRAVTPIIVDMFELILRKQCGIKVDDYCDKYKKDGKTVRYWSMKKLENTEVGRILNDLYKGEFREKNIYSHHLKGLIERYSNDAYLLQLVKDIRLVEANIRNLAAHEIVSITDVTIKELTGFIPEKIMKMIQELFRYTGISIKEEYWDSYDNMNRMILERIS